MERTGRCLPWATPRHELLLLALVGLVALSPVYRLNAQDISRLCLTRALQHGNLSNDKCFGGQIDKASYHGHLYSDKAPGMSVLEIPLARAFDIRSIEHMEGTDWRLWGIRVLSSGVAFLVCLLLVGRLAEGLAPGCGGAALVAVGLGTEMAGMAASNFGHVTAAALAFGGFLLAWRSRPALAGLAAGAATLVEYQAAAIMIALGVYVALRSVRTLAAFAAGAAPGIALLLAYNTLAFDAPWHFSYTYISNGYVLAQANGFFGVGAPKLFSTYEVFSGGAGLLVLSPVLVAALWGLGLLARRYTAEVVVCAAVTTFFLVLNCGYFLPYGGVSPGPRFVIPALPFLAVGLGPAFARYPRTTAVLASVSVVGTTAMTLVWGTNPMLRGTVWAELAHSLSHGRDTVYVRSLVRSAYEWIGIGRIGSAVLVFTAALAALGVGLAPALQHRRPASRRLALAVALSICLLAAASASAIGEYPYHGRVATVPAVLTASIRASNTIAVPGDEVDFFVTVSNPLPEPLNGVGLTVQLPQGLKLLGLPYYERGSGCTGSSTITCNLDFLMQRMHTFVRFGVRVLPNGDPERTVEAWATSYGKPGATAAATIITGS